MSNILYKVQTDLYWLSNGTSIKEVEYTKITEKCYYDKDNNRQFLDTTWSKCFYSKNDAIDFLKSKIDSSIVRAEDALNKAISQLETFNQLYKR